MKGEEQKACIFGGLILGAYVVYALTNPTADGVVFAAVVGSIGALGGYSFRAAQKG